MQVALVASGAASEYLQQLARYVLLIVFEEMLLRLIINIGLH